MIFVDYHVIHMRHRKDRLQNIRIMEKRLGQPIHIFEASGPEHREGWDNPGEVGCYKSHYRILSTSRESRFSVIFEDDFDIPLGFHNKVKRILRSIKNFDIIYLGNLDGNHKDQVVDNVYTVDTAKYLTGMHAYLIDNERTWNITSQLTYETAIDLEIPKRIAEGKVKAYVVWPPISHQNSSLHSFRNEKMCPRW